MIPIEQVAASNGMKKLTASGTHTGLEFRVMVAAKDTVTITGLKGKLKQADTPEVLALTQFSTGTFELGVGEVFTFGQNIIITEVIFTGSGSLNIEFLEAFTPTELIPE